jgi:hypothetical protein
MSTNAATMPEASLPADHDQTVRLGRQQPGLGAQLQVVRGDDAKEREMEVRAGTAMILERRAADAADVTQLDQPLGRITAMDGVAPRLRGDVRDQGFDVRDTQHRLIGERADIAAHADVRAHLRDEEQFRRACSIGRAQQAVDAGP